MSHHSPMNTFAITRLQLLLPHMRTAIPVSHTQRVAVWNDGAHTIAMFCIFVHFKLLWSCSITAHNRDIVYFNIQIRFKQKIRDIRRTSYMPREAVNDLFRDNDVFKITSLFAITVSFDNTI
jgi:hypothetical protein